MCHWFIRLPWYERTTIYVNIHLFLHVNFQFGSHHRPNCCEWLCTSLTMNGFLSLGEHLRVAKPCNKSMFHCFKRQPCCFSTGLQHLTFLTAVWESNSCPLPNLRLLWAWLIQWEHTDILLGFVFIFISLVIRTMEYITIYYFLQTYLFKFYPLLNCTSWDFHITVEILEFLLQVLCLIHIMQLFTPRHWLMFSCSWKPFKN